MVVNPHTRIARWSSISEPEGGETWEKKEGGEKKNEGERETKQNERKERRDARREEKEEAAAKKRRETKERKRVRTEANDRARRGREAVVILLATDGSISRRVIKRTQYY